MGSFHGKVDYHYQCLRCNVDLLKIMQLGITLYSEDGESPPATPHVDPSFDRNAAGRKNGNGVVQIPCTWQFNFKFSLADDMYSEKSIEERKLVGTDFNRLKEEGIDPFEFGALLISSGLVCDEDRHWISWHAGYDFGYVTKIMLQKALPDDEREFDMLMKKFFPSICDTKQIMFDTIKAHAKGQRIPNLDAATSELFSRGERPTQESLIELFKIKRLGNAHQAGSDSLVNGRVFFKVRERIFNGDIPKQLRNRLYGMSDEDDPNFAALQQSTQHFNQYQENAAPDRNDSGPTFGATGPATPFANGGPHTPNNGNANLASTPGHNSNNGGGSAVNPLTPGNGGSAFGNFQYHNK